MSQKSAEKLGKVKRPVPVKLKKERDPIISVCSEKNILQYMEISI